MGFQCFILVLNAAKIVTFFYFLPYGYPDFRSEIWHRLLAICFSFNMIKLKFCSWLMSKIIMILCKMKIITNCTDSPLFTLNISMANFWRFLSWIVKELSLSRSSSKKRCITRCITRYKRGVIIYIVRNIINHNQKITYRDIYLFIYFCFLFSIRQIAVDKP